MIWSKTRAAGLSIASNLSLTALKIVVGVFSGSMSIIAEAAHSGFDLIASFIAYYSVSVSDAPADEDHPYGHAKIENVSGVLESALIFLVSVWIVFEAVQKIRHRAEIEHLPLGIAIMFVSLLANIIVSRLLYRVAHRTQSIALEADAAHLWSDVLTSGGVILTLVAIYAGGHLNLRLNLLDPVFSIFIAVWILGIAYRLIRKSFPALMDVRAAPHMEKKIRGLIQEFCGDRCRFHKLRTRQSGAYVHIDFHLQFPPDTHILDAHRMSHELKRKIVREVPGSEAIIHLEPFEEAFLSERETNER